MASGRVPRTAMTLQGFVNCVRSKGRRTVGAAGRANHYGLPGRNDSPKSHKRTHPFDQPLSQGQNPIVLFGSARSGDEKLRASITLKLSQMKL